MCGRWTAAVARSVLEDQGRSGLSVSAFARERGLDPQRLYSWRRQLTATVEATKAFIEVVRPCATPSESALEVVLVSGDRIRVQGGVEGGLLRTVVKVLRSC